MSSPRLFIIVLSHNHRDDTFSCLQSLLNSDYENFDIILLESSSTVNETEEYRRQFPQIQVITLKENLGYAGNNNIGIHAALEQGADWIMILNNDTVLDTACLSHLVAAGEGDPEIGIVGPMVYHFDEPNVIQSAGGVLGKYWQNFHLGTNEADRGQFNLTRPVAWISGCAMMIRPAVMRQIGLFDEEYFLYWEETEFCIRSSRAGWKIIHVPDAKLWHKGVQRNYQPKPYVTYYSTRNYLFTLSKHKAPWMVRVVAVTNVIRTLLSWSVRPRWRDKREHSGALWRGMRDFLLHRMGPMAP
jgi:GT2 family glycosyltransferase